MASRQVFTSRLRGRPLLDDEGVDTGDRQVLIHPNDWTKIESLSEHAEHGVLAAFGIPVVKDP